MTDQQQQPPKQQLVQDLGNLFPQKDAAWIGRAAVAVGLLDDAVAAGLVNVDEAITRAAIESAVTGNTPAGNTPAGRSLAPDAMQKYLEFVGSNKDIFAVERLTAGSVICLGKGVFFLGLSTLGSDIWVRECYPLLLAAYKACKPRSDMPTVVYNFGTPGVGKSMLAALHVSQLLSEGRTVIIQRPLASHKDGYEWTRFKIGECVYLASTYAPFEADLLDPEAAYIVDGGLPRYEHFKAECFVYASPHKYNQRAIRKHIWGYKKFFTPMWTLDELLACREAVETYSADISAERVRELFWVGGGVAWTMFQRARTERQLSGLALAKELSDWVVSRPLHDLQSMCNSVEMHSHFPDASYCLLHWEVMDAQSLRDPNHDSPEDSRTHRYTQHHVQFASPYVAALVGGRHMKAVELLCASFIGTHHGQYQTAACFGHQFEALAHARLAAKGTWTLKLLGESQRQFQLELPASTPIAFHGVQGAVSLISHDLSAYLMPITKTCPAVDSLRSPALLFQITLGTSHSVVLDPLCHLVETLASKGPEPQQLLEKAMTPATGSKRKKKGLINKPLLVFVVPSFRARHWDNPQSFTRDNKVVHLPVAEQPVIQAVLEVPVENLM